MGFMHYATIINNNPMEQVGILDNGWTKSELK
jgi:hypothetical protein